MEILTGSAREVLCELIEYSKVNKNLNELFFEYQNRNQDDEYEQILEHLIASRYIQRGEQMDGVLNIRNLTYEGRNYLNLEKEDLEKQKQTHPTNVNNFHATNMIAQVGDNNTATQNIGTDVAQLEKLLTTLKQAIPADMSEEDKETVNDNIEIIREELQKPTPRKGFIKTAWNGINEVANRVPALIAAATAIYQFAQPFIS